MSNKVPAASKPVTKPRAPGYRPLFAGRPKLMLAATIVYAVIATLAMLFVGYAPPNLYQGF